MFLLRRILELLLLGARALTPGCCSQNYESGSSQSHAFRQNVSLPLHCERVIPGSFLGCRDRVPSRLNTRVRGQPRSRVFPGPGDPGHTWVLGLGLWARSVWLGGSVCTPTLAPRILSGWSFVLGDHPPTSCQPPGATQCPRGFVQRFSTRVSTSPPNRTPLAARSYWPISSI